jgi:hypothetical protein
MRDEQSSGSKISISATKEGPVPDLEAWRSLDWGYPAHDKLEIIDQ